MPLIFCWQKYDKINGQQKEIPYLWRGESLKPYFMEVAGIGIPAEEAEYIFEEFVQLDNYYDGTGIGLTVARSLARRLGGDIVLDTSYTTGARFVITLPK